MIEVRVTSELSGYEPKIIGPFTGRQLVCVAIGAPICYLIMTKLSAYMPIDATIPICGIPAFIGWLFGWYEPYGMKTEKFLKSIFITRILAPSIRRYKTENTHMMLLNYLEQEFETEPSHPSGKGSKKKKSSGQRKAKKLPPTAYL